MIGFAICGLTDKLCFQDGGSQRSGEVFINYCSKPGKTKSSRLKVEVMLVSLFETNDEGGSARDTEKNLRSILRSL